MINNSGNNKFIKPKGLEDFELAEIAQRKRLILALDGQTGKGKTHFALTAPDPIAYFDFDVRSSGVIHKFKDKQIWVSKYRLPVLDNQPLDVPSVIHLWDRFKTNFKQALAAQVKTIIVDTGTEAWELIRLARFGKASVKSYHYGPVNAEFKSLIRLAFEQEQDVNVILIHKKKKSYVDDKFTGEYERAGYGDIGYAVEVALDIDYYRDDEGVGHPTATITKCGLDVGMEDFELEDDLCCFDGLFSLLLG